MLLRNVVSGLDPRAEGACKLRVGVAAVGNDPLDLIAGGQDVAAVSRHKIGKRVILRLRQREVIAACEIVHRLLRSGKLIGSDRAGHHLADERNALLADLHFLRRTGLRAFRRLDGLLGRLGRCLRRLDG